MTDNELIEQIYKILRGVKLGGIDCRVATVIVSDICKAHYRDIAVETVRNEPFPLKMYFVIKAINKALSSSSEK